MLKNPSAPFLGFLQATGLVCYIGLIAAFFYNVERVFNNGIPEFIAPVIMLLLFVISAVITSLLVLGKAGVLFWERNYNQAFILLAWTLGWGSMYLVALLVILLAF